MKPKVPKIRVSDITNPSHRATGFGGAVSIKTKKIKIPSVKAIPENKTRTAIGRFRNLLRYLKSK